MSRPQLIPIGEVQKWLGHEFVSDWVLLDQERINRYAEVTGDTGWVHVDIARATALRGGTIAHGMLTLDLLPGLEYGLFEITEVEHGLHYGLNNVRFTGIVTTGGRVRLRVTPASVAPKGDGVLITMKFLFEREGETQPACVGEQMFVMFPKRQAATASA